jgi:hypothetical protein
VYHDMTSLHHATAPCAPPPSLPPRRPKQQRSNSINARIKSLPDLGPRKIRQRLRLDLVLMRRLVERDVVERDVEAEVLHPAAVHEGGVVGLELVAPGAGLCVAVLDGGGEVRRGVGAVDAGAGADRDEDHHVVGVPEQLAAFVQEVADRVVLGGAVVGEAWCEVRAPRGAGLGRCVAWGGGGGFHGFPDGHVGVELRARDAARFVGAHQRGFVGACFDVR